MRVGLVSTVRRVWAPGGVQVRQAVQRVRAWRYLVAAVDVQAGQLWWCWTETMSSAATASVVQGWRQHPDLEAGVWDGAPSHRSALVQDRGFPLVQQPAYAPELNPVERLFEELRCAVDGRVYASREAKVTAIEAELLEWDAYPERVRRLMGWAWIMDALDQLPQPHSIAA
jgi:hypothetical protein